MSENAETGAGTAGGSGAIPADAKKWAMICHISALSGLLGNGVGFILGPLIVWLIKKDDDPFIDEQGTEAVNFQLTMLIATIVSIPFCFILIGFLFLVVIFAMAVIFAIIAAIQASDGVHYRYPISIRMIKPRGA